MQKKTLILFAIIFIYLLNGILTIPKLSVTSDEGSHLDYGLRYIQGDPNRYFAEKDNSKMPISALNTIPRVFEQLTNKNLKKDDGGHSDAINGRYITLLFSVLTIIVIFFWSKDLFGINSGLFAAFLMSWCPNNLAAATLTTTDAYSSFFLLATLYFLYRWFKDPNYKSLFYFSLFIALSQLAKQSLFHLYPICAIIIILVALYNQKKPGAKIILKGVLFFAITNWIIINTGFLFNQLFIPLSEYHFLSDTFKGLQSYLPRQLPVPFSKSFVEGLDMAKYYDQIGGGRTGIVESSFGNVTILNRSSTGGAFWYFYFVTLLYKTPLPYFFLLFAAIFIGLRNKIKSSAIPKFILWIPVFYFIIILSFFYNTQCGVRHIVFIYPLVFIYCGQLINLIKSSIVRNLIVLLCLWLVISVSLFRGNYFSYTNELIWNKTNAYTKVGADNLFFNQSWKILDIYLHKNKSVTIVPDTPRSGTFVIGVDHYLDIWNTGKYNWINHIKPIGNIANGSILIVPVTEKDLLNIK